MRVFILVLFACSLALVDGQAQEPLRFPNVGANRIRVEAHLLPAVSTGPLDPTWSPGGEWLAFSMRGDIWRVPVGGGEAVALTAGPAYHFEPAWSPDGQFVALTMDVDGNLDIGLVRADGGEVRRLTTDPHVDIEPTWRPDGAGLYFVSARGGSFDILFYDLETDAISPVIEGPGHQVQPAPSPDGSRLAYISPVRGRLGTGGIWVRSLPAGEPELVHYEETSYRTKPAWSPDGSQLLFVSDESGTNDVATVPAAGGSKARLTESAQDTYAPVMSPDGSTIAFVANGAGPMQLYVMPAGGAREEGWQRVALTSRRPRSPTGRVRVRVLGPDRSVMPARVYLQASDGRAYAPDGGFHRVISSTETHYFHTEGTFEVEVPVGTVAIEAMRGFEYVPASTTVEVAAGRTQDVSLTLERLVDATARGWYSGETHAHDLHQGRYGLTHETFFLQLTAEDLRVTNALIHMDGTRIMGRWEDLTGEPHPLSTSDHILQYAQEFRGSLGHVGLLGVDEFIMPLIGGTTGTAFAADVLNFTYLDAARAQGGIGGFMHPFSRPVAQPADGAVSEIALDVALGKGEFYDVLCIWYDEIGNAEMYYRLLNTGVRLAGTAGSDNFADVWRDPPPGTTRTYAYVNGPVTVPLWLDAIKAGRTFGTSGPLVFMTVDGKFPGDEITLADDERTTFEVDIDVASITPLERVEIVVNGDVVETIDVVGRERSFHVSSSVTVERSGWIAARVIGPSSRYVTDTYAFAHTSPVYVVRHGERYVSTADAAFLAEMVEEMWRRVERRDRWTTPGAKEAYRQAVEEAVRVYRNKARSTGTSN